MDLTAVYIEVPEGYIAFVEELPGANTQGATLDEACANLREAVELVLDANWGLPQNLWAEIGLNGRRSVRFSEVWDGKRMIATMRERRAFWGIRGLPGTFPAVEFDIPPPSDKLTSTSSPSIVR